MTTRGEVMSHPIVNLVVTVRGTTATPSSQPHAYGGDMNVLTVTGRLDADPVRRDTPKGRRVRVPARRRQPPPPLPHRPGVGAPRRPLRPSTSRASRHVAVTVAAASTSSGSPALANKADRWYARAHDVTFLDATADADVDADAGRRVDDRRPSGCSATPAAVSSRPPTSAPPSASRCRRGDGRPRCGPTARAADGWATPRMASRRTRLDHPVHVRRRRRRRVRCRLGLPRRQSPSSTAGGAGSNAPATAP